MEWCLQNFLHPNKTKAKQMNPLNVHQLVKGSGPCPGDLKL